LAVDTTVSGERGVDLLDVGGVADVGAPRVGFVQTRLRSVLVHRPTSLWADDLGLVIATVGLAAALAGRGANMDVMSVGTTHLSHGPLISRRSIRAPLGR